MKLTRTADRATLDAGIVALHLTGRLKVEPSWLGGLVGLVYLVAAVAGAVVLLMAVAGR